MPYKVDKNRMVAWDVGIPKVDIVTKERELL